MTEYVKSIVTFIDILGFKKLLAELNADGSYVHSPDEIERILDEFQNITGYDGFIKLGSERVELSIMRFSDCLVRCARVTNAVDDHEWPGLRAAEILSIALMQFVLSGKGIFIRGGMTEGDIRIDAKKDKVEDSPITTSETRVFGPALVEAYELEHHKAVLPRIILEPAVIPQFKKDLSEQDTVNGFLNDRNDRTYIDYLHVSRWYYDQKRLIDSYPPALDSHRKMIVANLKKHTDERILAKYRWLAKYHNAFLDDPDEEWEKLHGVAREELRINLSDLGLKSQQ